MFQLSVPWWEFVIRGIAVYAFLIAVLRLTGKRQVGQLAPFDLILLLILSNAVQNSMNAGDNSLIGGLISAATLVAINWCVSFCSYRIPGFEAALDGRPIVLVKNGRSIEATLASEHITKAELMTGLRASGGFKVSDVKLAILEPNGHISVWTKADAGPDAQGVT